MKSRLKKYQSNNMAYLNEIKDLKLKLDNTNRELMIAKNNHLADDAAKENRRKLEELESCLNDSKDLILNMKSKCNKLKQEKKELVQKLKDVDYIKASIICSQIIDFPLITVSYTHLTLPTICSV
eukprot:TRINITY_DN21010_c0_g1_i3.p2 TRINITY_DN21010_c0_g1~~TRINITY_DN21010_c0_g1_i3.p2  ORF type:complete len:125 (-),score=45.25 TRINITY_DN21010_c0_g1_i3:37-411(-)